MVNADTLEHWDRTLRDQRGVVASMCVAITIVGEEQEAHVLQGPCRLTANEVVAMLRNLARTMESGPVRTRRAR